MLDHSKLKCGWLKKSSFYIFPIMTCEDYDGKTGFFCIGREENKEEKKEEGRRNRVERGKEKDEVFYL